WRGRIQLLIDQQQAVALFRKAVELAPDNFNARRSVAAALAEYDPHEAIWHLEVLRRRDPNNDEVVVLLASLHRGLGQLKEAQSILDEVLASNPEQADAVLERGKVALDAGDHQGAEPFLRRALLLNADDPFVHLALSR